jgi:hypothetical protein
MMRDGMARPRIHEVDWTALEAACAPADALPAILEDIRTRSGEAQRSALLALEYRVLHQGVLETGSVAVVPFLCAMVVDRAVAGRHSILALLTNLGRNARRELEAAFHVAPYVAPGDDYAPIVTAMQSAMVAERATFAEAARDPDVLVRRATPHLLAQVADGSRDDTAELATRAAEETEPVTRASFVLGLGLVGHRYGLDPVAAASLATHLDDPETVVAVASAMALAQWRPEEIEPRRLARISEGIRHHGERLPAFPWTGSVLAHHATDVLGFLARADRDRYGSVLVAEAEQRWSTLMAAGSRPVGERGGVRDSRLRRLIDWSVTVMFAEYEGRSAPLTDAELSPSQRRLIDLLFRSEASPGGLLQRLLRG